MSKLSLALVVLLGVAPMVNAVNIAGTDIGVTADVTYMSRYIWRGFNLFGSSPAWQPSLDFDLGGGFGANIWASYAHNAGNVDATEYDYTLYYGNSFLQDCWKTDYTVGWRYFDYIDTGSKNADMQELFLEMEMPQLIGGGLVPHINYYYLWKARSGGPTRIQGGSMVEVGADYNFTLNEMPDVPMTFSWDIVYNDGVFSTKDRTTGQTASVVNDFTHMLWGLKADLKCPATGGTITPQLYFQNTFTRSMNDSKKDYLFCGLSYSLSF